MSVAGVVATVAAAWVGGSAAAGWCVARWGRVLAAQDAACGPLAHPDGPAHRQNPHRPAQRHLRAVNDTGRTDR